MCESEWLIRWKVLQDSFPLVSGTEVQRRSGHLPRKPQKHLNHRTQGQGCLLWAQLPGSLDTPAPRD